MRSSTTSIGLKGLALFLLLSLSSAANSSAQTQPQPNLEHLLSPGTTVWITDAHGRVEKKRIVGVSRDSVTTIAGKDVRRLHTTEIMRVQVRRADSLLNGALIGAGAGVSAGLLLCTAMEPWENCRDDVGPVLGVGAIGAGIGIVVDALIRRRVTIYDAQGSPRLRAAPLVWDGVAGVQLSLRF